jgi:outer membrane biosynthesis protein TonB
LKLIEGMGMGLGVMVGLAAMWAMPSNDAPVPSVVVPIKTPPEVTPAAVPTVPIPAVTPEPVDQPISPATPAPSSVSVKPKPSKVQRKQPLKEEPVQEPSPADVKEAPLVIIE